MKAMSELTTPHALCSLVEPDTRSGMNQCRRLGLEVAMGVEAEAQGHGRGHDTPG